jgi:putative heme transporter
MVVAIALHRQELGVAVTTALDLPVMWLSMLGVATVATVLAAGWAVATVHPGLGVARSITVHQATIAASYTVIASGPVSLALRVSMLRSWRMSDRTIATSVVVSNVVSSFRLWIMTLAVAGIGLAGAATEVLDRWVFLMVAILAVVVLTLSTLWWWFVIRHPRLAAWCTIKAQRLLTRLRRRWHRLPDLDLMKAVDGFRHEVSSLVRHRGHHIAMASTVEMLVMLTTPVLVARAFGIGSSTVSTAEIVLAFGMVRLASALSPIPGGIGVSEIGATLLLVRFGAPDQAVLATVVTHRAITFFVPMVLGGACVWWWHRRHGAVNDRGACDIPPESAPDEPSPLADRRHSEGTRCGSGLGTAS